MTHEEARKIIDGWLGKGSFDKFQRNEKHQVALKEMFRLCKDITREDFQVEDLKDWKDWMRTAIEDIERIEKEAQDAQGCDAHSQSGG